MKIALYWDPVYERPEIVHFEDSGEPIMIEVYHEDGDMWTSGMGCNVRHERMLEINYELLCWLL